jgi:hypothetical protein
MSNKVLLAASISSLLVFAGTAIAGSDQTSTVPITAGKVSPSATGENPDEVICRVEAPVTGSRLGGHRVCLTRQR